MFDFIPLPLRARLGDELADLLGEVVLLVDRVLRQVYEMDARAYDPSVGDNPQLFGLGIWHHGWFAIEEELEDWEGVAVVHEDNSHRVQIGDLTLAVYKGGDSAADSIYDVNLNGSATKRDYVSRNQLQLFSVDEIELSVDDRAYELKTLLLVHFGNPREQLVKLYLGAPSRDADDRNVWAWYARVDTPDAGGGDRLPETPPSFDQRPEPEIELELDDGLEEAGGAGGE